MTDVIVYLNGSGQRKNPGEVWFELPSILRTDSRWQCALLDVSLDCKFTPKRDSLYLCGDFLEDTSYIDRHRAPVLRRIKVRGKYQKELSLAYTTPIYVPLRPHPGDLTRLRLLDEHLQTITFDEDVKVQYVLRFRRPWVP